MANKHWIRGLGFAGCLLASGSALAYAELLYETLAGASQPVHDLQFLTAPDSVSGSNYSGCTVNCGFTGAYAWAAGFADATRLSVGVRTTAGTYSNSEGGESRAIAYLTNTFTVNSSSLAPGTPLTLQFAAGLSGSFAANSGSQIIGAAALGIIEGSTVPRPGDQYEFQQHELLSFTANWKITETGGYGMYTGVGWQANLKTSYNQNNYGFNGSGSYYGLCDSGRPNCFYSYTGAGMDPFDNPYPASYSLSVPGLVLDFAVEVGGTYSVFEYLAITHSDVSGLGAGGQPSEVVADFSHTLAGVVQTGSNEVTLAWTTPLAAVPEPPAAATWLAGLAMLGIALRRSGRKGWRTRV